MKQQNFIIESNEQLSDAIYKIILSGSTDEITAAGQFVNIKLDGYYLRRPISVCDCENGRLTLIYKVVGKGTLLMSKLKKGHTVDVLTGLGNGYDETKSGFAPLLIGGGVGIPPLYLLAKRLVAAGKSVTVILGFNTKSEIFYAEEFQALGVKVLITTADGSEGIKGFVTDAIPLAGEYTYFYSCGPKPMLKAVCEKAVTGGQVSLEERMGCGFGACMGCTCQTKTGAKRICKDGPVFEKEELEW